MGYTAEELERHMSTEPDPEPTAAELESLGPINGAREITLVGTVPPDDPPTITGPATVLLGTLGEITRIEDPPIAPGQERWKDFFAAELTAPGTGLDVAMRKQRMRILRAEHYEKAWRVLRESLRTESGAEADALAYSADINAESWRRKTEEPRR